MNVHAVGAIRAALQSRGLAGYIAYTPSSVFYVTGFRSYFVSEWWRMHGTVLAFVPADESQPVTLLVSDFEAGTAADAAPEVALSTYRLWVDLSTAEQMAVRPDAGVPLRPEQWDDAEVDRRVSEVLAGLGMAAGSVATELGHMNGATSARLRRCAPDATWVDFTDEVYAIRLVKQEWEIDRLRRGVELSEAGMSYAAGHLEKGMTAQDVRALYQVGVAQETVGNQRYHGYSDNWVLPTVGGTTSAGYGAVSAGLQPGDLVKFDCGVTIGGYRSDGGRTFAFGHASDAARRLYDVVARAQEIARSAIAPGVVIGDVYRAAMDHVHANGYPTFNRGHIGHSIGIDSFHEEPPYLGPACRQTFEVGMVFAVEVPTYTPDVGAMMVEDLVVVREGGAEVLHRLSHDLIVV
ncbi:Xaa-Pro aminopeptidase [Geodermatophilus saharensis]|uniref:Xaa-Pro aminopeptidase n=1 Tax=Geodermatophilus saharensis TaxID=1137994 RepID=A0A239HRK5_9ACTN|nr:Xaa-Pro peptidase family protein [Geodermatophilus saharensis]SNS83979.1 Xaa-Pro aminopeptidase [Geodermatophilus saharensis]